MTFTSKEGFGEKAAIKQWMIKKKAWGEKFKDFLRS